MRNSAGHIQVAENVFLFGPLIHNQKLDIV
jgi:hypothetical protein